MAKDREQALGDVGALIAKKASNFRFRHCSAAHRAAAEIAAGAATAFGYSFPRDAAPRAELRSHFGA